MPDNLYPPKRPTIEELGLAIDPIQAEIANRTDEFIIRFFGSRELAEEYIKYYVLESEPYQFESWFLQDSSAPYFKLTCTETIRIRRKTDDELEAEGLL